MKIEWMDEPEDKNWRSALQFSTLLDIPVMVPGGSVMELCRLDRFGVGKYRIFLAKDILRAARLDPLPKKSDGVDDKLDKIEDAKPLAPVILYRGNPLVILDGYHRVSAAYHLDEETEVRCYLV